MMNPPNTRIKGEQAPTREFSGVVEEIGLLGRKKHESDLLRHAEENAPRVRKTLRELPKPTGKKAESALMISAGPSIHKRNSIQRIIDSGYQGSIICVDASYVACLRKGLIPDYVVTLDPHKSRIVRWFGDKNYEEHRKNDDYFERQDLNVEFRKNSIRQNQENIDFVNTHGHKTKAIVASSAPANVVERIEEGKCDTYWWNPLVDDPRKPDSITRRLHAINKLPAMNTGGNVGGASWVFAATILGVPRVGMVGMDFGYYPETPYTLTQTYYELLAHLGSADGIEKYFCEFNFPLTGEKFYTDPTYYWYRKNFFDLLEKAPQSCKTYNCSEGGTLFNENIECPSLDDFLAGK